jgi:hypothetical protein
MNRMQASQIHEWSLHINHDVFSDKIFHRQNPVLNSVLKLSV